MTSVTLHEGDNREHLRRLIAQGVRVHSVCTDPPYGLTSVTKRFGGDKAAPAKFGTDGAFQRVGAGFMGSKWDGTGIERDPEFWRLIYDILLPGGYVVAFSSPRTGHWQACAMEIAGFVMHPFLGWLYGSGMPKAHNAAMAIDKALGVKGTRGAPKSAAHAGWIERGQMRDGEGHEGWQRPWMDDAGKVDEAARVYQPASDEAKPWDGWAYGAQALKPALEPIYVGQKPFEGKTGPANFLKHGVGAINIAACRVEATGESRPRVGEPSAVRDYGDGGVTDFTSQPGPRGGSPEGRHPANLLHDGSPEVVALFPESKGQLAPVGPANGSRPSVNCYGDFATRMQFNPRQDADASAARFFNAFTRIEEELDQAIEELDVSWTSATGPCQVRLQVDTAQSPPKVIAASGSGESSDWNTFLFGNGITALCQTGSKSIIGTRTSSTTPSAIWSYLTRSLTSVCTADAISWTESGGSRVENAGERSTLTLTMSAETEFLPGAAPALSQTQLTLSVGGALLAVEPALYHGKAKKADRAGSGHPTVKPIALMRWLCRLVTPAGGVVLDPFGGSGTTGAAAIAEGFEAILMEAEPRFAADIRARFGLARPVFHYSSEFDDVLGGVEPEIEDVLG